MQTHQAQQHVAALVAALVGRLQQVVAVFASALRPNVTVDWNVLTFMGMFGINTISFQAPIR